ncbi:MAG: hypothetical protein HQK67_10460 [Desulfamplus sp.]|nr:hypothetical protein [Desulfamplus sp.]
MNKNISSFAALIVRLKFVNYQINSFAAIIAGLKCLNNNIFKTRRYASLYQIFQFFLLLSLFTSNTGCSVLKSLDDKLHSDKKIIEAGEDAFIQGNYQLAETLFQKVISNSKNPRNKNTAIYNLACTKLITAESDAEFIEATEMLTHWKPSHKIPMYYENPRLIIQAVLNITDLVKDKEGEFKGFSAINDMHTMREIDSIVKETNQINTRLDRLIREQDAKIKTLSNVVKKQNEKIKLLNAIFKKESKTKEEMEQTIKTLKHQISELESIDRKLQNKRTTQ